MSMPGSEDITIKVLEQIRDGIGRVEQEIAAVKTEVVAVKDEVGRQADRLDARIDQTRLELVAAETRFATRVNEHTVATRNLYDLLQDRFALRDRVEQCEHRIAELEHKVG